MQGKEEFKSGKVTTPTLAKTPKLVALKVLFLGFHQPDLLQVRFPRRILAMSLRRRVSLSPAVSSPHQ
jgi:hypothetical protein